MDEATRNGPPSVASDSALIRILVFIECVDK